MEQGFHDIPHPKERASMSPEKLAIVLSECTKDSPQYILVSHELNVRIAKVQSRAAYGAAFLGLGGVVLGAFLAMASVQWQKNWQEPVAEGNHIGENQVVADPPKPPQAVVSKPAATKVDAPAASLRCPGG